MRLSSSRPTQLFDSRLRSAKIIPAGDIIRDPDPICLLSYQTKGPAALSAEAISVAEVRTSIEGVPSELIFP